MPIFKQSILVQAVVILLAMAALWAGAIAHPQPMPMPQGSDVLYGVLYGWLGGMPGLAVAVAMLVVLASGVLLNVLLVDVGLSAQNSMLPTLLYVICMSAPATTLTPMTMVSLLMVVCMRQLAIKGTLLTIPPERACMATALIGICTMFYLPAVLLMLSYSLVVINYRLYSVRDWAIMLLGFLAPYILLAIVLMFTDGLPGWWQGVADAVASVHPYHVAMPLLQVMGGALMVAAIMAGVVAVWRNAGESTVQWQKNAVTLLSALLGGLAIWATSRLFPVDMQLFALPFTFGVGCLLMPRRSSTLGSRKRREWIYTLLLFIIFFAAIIC